MPCKSTHLSLHYLYTVMPCTYGRVVKQVHTLVNLWAVCLPHDIEVLYNSRVAWWKYSVTNNTCIMVVDAYKTLHYSSCRVNDPWHTYKWPQWLIFRKQLLNRKTCHVFWVQWEPYQIAQVTKYSNFYMEDLQDQPYNLMLCSTQV